MDKQYNINSGDVYNLHESALSVANYGTVNIFINNLNMTSYTAVDIPILEDKVRLAARNMDFETTTKYRNMIMELSEEER